MKTKSARLSDATWEEIKLGFLAGKSVPDLAAQYGILPSRIHKRATRKQWVRDRERFGGEIEELSNGAFERAKSRFKNTVAASFEPWLEAAEEMRRSIKAGDVDGFHKAVSAVVKLHQSGQRHFSLGAAPALPIIIPGVLTGMAEPEPEE